MKLCRMSLGAGEETTVAAGRQNGFQRKGQNQEGALTSSTARGAREKLTAYEALLGEDAPGTLSNRFWKGGSIRGSGRGAGTGTGAERKDRACVCVHVCVCVCTCGCGRASVLCCAVHGCVSTCLCLSVCPSHHLMELEMYTLQFY
jgi:hypothetical protein